jgi:hypothetical protein
MFFFFAWLLCCPVCHPISFDGRSSGRAMRLSMTGLQAEHPDMHQRLLKHGSSCGGGGGGGGGSATATDFIYGELTFDAIAAALEKVRMWYGARYWVMQTGGGKFYDLGSGTGTAVFAAGWV